MSAVRLLIIVALAIPAFAQSPRALLNGKNLDGWESHGNGLWTVLSDGTLLGQRHQATLAAPFNKPWPIDARQFRSWLNTQAWLYTKDVFTEFDLHVEYFLPPGMNSGVSIRDNSRGKFATGEATEADGKSLGTPAHVGYEIQIIDDEKEKYPTGSVYLFQVAKTGLQKQAAWNTLDIESRNAGIRVRVNGQLVAESTGDPARSKTGPIGLQLHDQFTFVMFRNITIQTH